MYRSLANSFATQNRTNRFTSRRPVNRFLRGFTLVEMMISVALVLIIMTMFASIFQIAAGSLSKQRGLAENDQRARLLNTIIRGDLDKRSFRDVIPFAHNQDTRALGGLLLLRSGYWYYAENDPSDDTDDVLQFTARTSIRAQSADSNPYTGVANPLSAIRVDIIGLDINTQKITVDGDVMFALPVTGGHIWISESYGTGIPSTNNGRYRLSTTNPPTLAGSNTEIYVDRPIYSMSTLGKMSLTEFQPDLDDGIPGNKIGQSATAEIAYFLRNGNLHRRVLLVRDADTGGTQPRLETGATLMGTAYPNLLNPTGQFWRDFDYSAYYFRGNYDGANLVGQGPRFHTASESLNNDANAPKDIMFSMPLPLPAPLIDRDQFRITSLGVPQLRFGHDPWTGIPREFVYSGTDNTLGTFDDYGFMGRFTTSECSDPNFGYPGTMSLTPADPSQDITPMNNTALTLNNGVVTNYSTSTQRRGADVLMTNVLGFDVKVWDPAVGGFVDVGDNSITGGSFIPGNCQNTYYSPNTKFRYDTWHPQAEAIRPNSTRDGVNPPFTTQVTAVQITINYRDISSDQIRQMTIVQSLVDPY